MAGRRGFTLIEMALVIAIIGLLVSGGIFAVTPLLRQAKVNTTQTALDQLDAALALFVIRNNRLPCPADGSFSNTNASYGIEPSPTPISGGPCTVGATSRNGFTVANSVIPWRTLGLDESYSIDGWNNRISYFPANSLITGVNSLVDSSTGAARACAADPTGSACTLCMTRSTAPTPGTSTRATLCDPTTGAMAGLTPTYPYGNYIAVYSINATGNQYGTELTAPQPANINTAAIAATAGLRAAYVLVSHGPSGWFGWTKAGTPLLPYANGGSALKAYNGGGGTAGTNNNLGFVQGAPQFLGSLNNPNYFDDIVRWRSPGIVIQNCGSTACGNP
jgi:prepilin-type N-terminal cleavage/methylation domain-containing protein